MEEDGFVIVSKDLMVEDDTLSNASSRSSLFLVEDPAADEVMLNGEKEEETVSEKELPPPAKTIEAQEVIAEPESEDSVHEELQQAEEVQVRKLAISAKPIENLLDRMIKFGRGKFLGLRYLSRTFRVAYAPIFCSSRRAENLSVARGLHGKALDTGGK